MDVVLYLFLEEKGGARKTAHFTLYFSGYSSAWLERCVRDAEARGSNPLTPTNERKPRTCLKRVCGFFIDFAQKIAERASKVVLDRFGERGNVRNVLKFLIKFHRKNKNF